MPMSCHKLILALCLAVTTPLVSVTSVLAADQEPAQKVVKSPKAAPIVGLETASELKNRFRIDHMVDNMTLLVEREYGSAPVVIVLPDGSKWYANRHPETVKWVDGITGDIIYIESPMPGPWQLVGKVVPGSTLKKLSKLEIEVQPLPQPIFQGEQVKIVAQLMGDAQRVRMPGLDFLVEWTAHFVSKHRAGDENFAAGDIIVGSYKDNGEDYDEKPDDGVFTSNINVKQPWGDYEFVVQARNNVFERQISFPFRLSPRPINLEVITPDDPLTGQWKIMLHVDSAVLQLAETHFSFELVGPAGLQLPLTVNGLTEPDSELDLPTVTEFGSYRIKGFVATTTITGREIVLDLPELFFNLIQPPEPPPSAEELAAVAAQKAAEEEELAKKDAMFWIITINTILLVLGVVGLIVWRKRQSLAQALAAAESRLLEEASANSAAAPSLDEIDLTMPDEADKDR
ncbi:MAG: TIGR03503 family protein [Gammaproteobacteria bacterium]|nr:TIGR03503 family protein [Morganella morganii]MBU1393847.1 TIGR03503 family protein [Gammaproteobacteria bacterium]MBU1479355.1 TIGR03503 family protein [Gammaproteobacteria bacterium]MBU2002063.1 TIGR03503 family protein [Gammaproteobacteria bacterium]MBU2133266.1 TIGR03503 family protein [Gammaproteobacteria bacterium]